MRETYYHLEDYVPLAKRAKKSQRCKDLLEAIDVSDDFSLVQVLVNTKEDRDVSEAIVVDVKTQDVPSRNTVGISFVERLALVVPCNSRSLVKVLALRKDFPVTMHQNAVPEDFPCDLCLYSESTSAVLRVWTPGRFLQRIQWWLAHAARGELHAPGQELEPLFYNSGTTIILPSNFKSTCSGKYYARLIRNEAGSHETLRLIEEKHLSAEEREHYLDIDIISVVTPSVVHGPIEKYPPTLGRLAQLLLDKKVSLYEPLKTAIHASISKDGKKRKRYENSVILVCTPIKRGESSEAERVDIKGFFIPYSISTIGVALGILSESNGTVSKGIILQETGAGVTNLSSMDYLIHPLEVLEDFSAATGKIQSGIDCLDPKGVIIGVGALGSSIADIWLRSGWGKWTVVDCDHIKPHNLARHIAFSWDIGVSKAKVIEHRHRLITDDDDEVCKALCVDACDFSNEALLEVIRKAEIVVDISTTADYPRLVSKRCDFPRHVSLFTSPSGDASILLAEDSSRDITLDSLEAQYYRAIISSDDALIQKHLYATKTVRSGLGCSDRSSIISLSSISVHAGILSTQVQNVIAKDDAVLAIWVNDKATDNIYNTKFPVFKKQSQQCLDFTVNYDSGFVSKLRQMRDDHLPNETGGVLLGYIDYGERDIHLVDALLGPIDSRGTENSFERGVLSLAEKIKVIREQTGNMVGYIGEWHSHPRGHSSVASSFDIEQLSFIAGVMSEEGLPGLQLIVGEDNESIYLYFMHVKG